MAWPARLESAFFRNANKINERNALQPDFFSFLVMTKRFLSLSLSLPRVSFFLLISVAHNVSFSPSNSFPPTNNQLSHGSLSHKFFCCISLESQAFFFNPPSPSIKTNTKKKRAFTIKADGIFSLSSRSTHVFIADGPFLKTKGVN